MSESVQHVETVLLWMIAGLSGSNLETACIGKLGVEPAQAGELISEARKRLTLAAEYNRDEMLGTALTRLNDLYGRCIRAGGDGIGPNLAKALDVQKEINRIAGFHKTAEPSGGGDESMSESAAELAAVAAELLPLGLAAESYPLREHARLAAQRIKELETLQPHKGNQ